MLLDRVARQASALVVALMLLAGPAPSGADPVRLRQAAEAMQRGDARTAVVLLEREVDRMRRTPGERDPETLGAMADLADAYEAVGRLADALATMQRVLELRLHELESGHPDTLHSLNSVARLLALQGRHAEAIETAERGLTLSRQTHGERSAHSAAAMQTLATLLSGSGRVGEALELEEKVLEVLRAVRFAQHPDTLAAMGNLASTYRQLGRHELALPLEQEVLAVLARTQGEHRPMTMTAMNNLAGTYSELGRYREAAVLHERVLRGRSAEFGAEHPDTLAAMLNLAANYRAVGRVADAGVLARRALEIGEKVLGERHPVTIAALGALAALDRSAGRGDEAERLALRRLALATEVHGPDHQTTLGAVLELARAHAGVGRFHEAAALTNRYVAGTERVRAAPGLGAVNRRSLFQDYVHGYRQLAYFNTRAVETGTAFRLTELSKARTLLDAMASHRAARSGVLPAAERAALEDLDRRIATQDALIAQAAGADSRQEAETRRNEIVRQHEVLQTAMKARFPKYAQLGEVRILAQHELPGLVPADAVAVSYLVDGDWVGAFVVDHRGETEFVDLGIIELLAEKVAIVRRAVGEFGSLDKALADAGRKAWRMPDGEVVLTDLQARAPPYSRAEAGLGDFTAHLGDRLLRRIAHHLRDKPRWIVSPDGPLAHLPFDLLAFDGPGQPAVASAAIHYTQSLSVYALSKAMQTQYAALSGRRSLLAMGNPEYLPAQDQAARRSGAAPAKEPRSPLRLSELDRLWTSLPGTEAEVRAVAALFPGSASVHLGAQATEQRLIELQASGQLRDFRYLLISAHGFVSQDQPALSSVVLGLRRKTPLADGYVTASEWLNYDLRSDLMVLSACDTALGQVVGGEGVMGLPYALFVAGNVNTLLTLWPVVDAATTEFVTAFFAHLRRGASASDALARTKREFARHPKYAHPRHWAPFVLIGAG